MYKIYTPHGIVETESLKEVQEHLAQGDTFEKVPDEHSPESMFDDLPDEEVFDPEGLNYVITGEAFIVD